MKLDPIHELMPTNGESWNEVILRVNKVENAEVNSDFFQCTDSLAPNRIIYIKVAPNKSVHIKPKLALVEFLLLTV